MEIKILKDVLGVNDQQAKENRSLLDEAEVTALNITASPGAGKTSIIMQTIQRLKERVRFGVIEGDVSSSIDAERVRNEDIPVVQINTGGACHLDAAMVKIALSNLPLKEIDLLIIENVGNLICPASFALGENKNVLIASVPEGDDKPYKYPLMFAQADAVLLNKIDLLPYTDFEMDAFTRGVRNLNEKAQIFKISCKTGEGVESWTKWVLAQLDKTVKGAVLQRPRQARHVSWQVFSS